MPIREYIAVEASASCTQCKEGFEHIETVDAEPIETCPECGETGYPALRPRKGRKFKGSPALEAKRSEEE